MEDRLLIPITRTGPSVLCRGHLQDGDVTYGAGILAAYTKGDTEMDIEVIFLQKKQKRIIPNKLHLDKEILAKWRIGTSYS